MLTLRELWCSGSGERHFRNSEEAILVQRYPEWEPRFARNYRLRAAKVVAQSRVRLIVVGVSIGVAIGIQEPRLAYNGIATATCS